MQRRTHDDTDVEHPTPLALVPRKHSRRVGGRRLAALLVAGSLGVAACGGSSGRATDSPAPADSTGTSATAAGFDPSAYRHLKATLNGSGSSFQANFNNAGITTLTGVIPGLTINYGGGGSGKGKTDLKNKVVDFAGTDSLVKAEDRGDYAGKLLYFPTVVAPITVPYRLADVERLQLDGPTIAKIFTRAITSWDDPALVALNPDATLPDLPITVCHRSDASGTTTNFTRFLVAAGGPAWTLGSSDAVDWDPATQGGSGNAGVAQCVKGGQGTIGYVDLSDAQAQKLQVAAVRNRAGAFMLPTLEGASAAAGGADIAADLTFSPIDSDGAEVYPITSPTWIIVTSEQTDAVKAEAIVAFLRFLLTDGQQLAAGSGYAPLPAELATRALAQLDEIVQP